MSALPPPPPPPANEPARTPRAKQPRRAPDDVDDRAPIAQRSFRCPECGAGTSGIMTQAWCNKHPKAVTMKPIDVQHPEGGGAA